MLISKMVQIEFANPKIKAINVIQDIREGAKAAGMNLYARYGVQLQSPMPLGDDKVVVEIKIPEDRANSFAVGNHLRGISAYLLKYCGGRYDAYVVGKRLFNYIELDGADMDCGSLSMAVRLEMIADLSRLLKRSDREAMEQINRIRAILEEAQQ